MLPSILQGDRIVVDKIAYDIRVPFTLLRIARLADPSRSDVITFESPQDGKLLVKRVIGIPGDQVELRHNRLFINGEAAQYDAIPADLLPDTLKSVLPFIEVARETVLGETRTVMLQRHRHPQIRDSFGPLEVPEDHYLVLGDNRDNSQDFRVIGFVQRDLILGKANAIAFSLDYDNYYVPRSDRFFRELH